MPVHVGDSATLHALVPRPLKRRLRLALAWEETTYVEWLCQRIEGYVVEVEQRQRRDVEAGKHDQAP